MIVNRKLIACLFGRFYICGFLILQTGCHSRSPVEEMSGTYVGEYADGIETYHLNRNGTFIQEFDRHGKTIYVNWGRWDIQYGNMEFFNIMVPFQGEHINRYPMFIVSLNDGVIIFDEDRHIYLTET